MYFQPPRALGLLIGAVLTLWSAGAAFVLANHAVTSDPSVGALLAYTAAIAMGLLAFAFAYWTYALATLTYILDRNGLVISWGTTRQVIPLEAIERLVPGTAIESEPRVHGVSWWGYHVGGAEVPRIGRVLFYSTHQEQGQVLYVMTAERNYAISIPDPLAFAREIQTRQDLGSTAAVTHHVERSAVVPGSLLADRRAAILLALAVAACLAVWLQVVVRYPDLPPTLNLRFPPIGDSLVNELVSRSAIFEVPRVGTGLLVANVVGAALLYGWDRMTSYVLLAAAAALQIAMFVAVLSAIG